MIYPHVPSRTEDEGRKCVEAAILTAITLVDTLDEAGRQGEHLSGNIAEAIIWAIDEVGYEDHEALAATSLARLGRQQLHADFPQYYGVPDNIMTGKGG